MVLLTLSSDARDALREASRGRDRDGDADADVDEPISHTQLVSLYKTLRQEQAHDEHLPRLEALLKGAQVYRAPPEPKPQPVRLRIFVLPVTVM